MNKLFISCKESRIESNRSFYGCFYLGPFDSSQSLTVANALRRTLLSECTGLGITSVMIENVHHEYSTLPNVRDSVLDILLNLKEIVLKKVTNPWNSYMNTGLNGLYEEVGSSYFKPVIGYLKVKGPGVIRAKNLRLPPFIQCVDPEQYIATLTDDGILNIKFIIMEGKNYFIQKDNSFIDSGLVKKRETLLKELQELLNSDSKKAANNSSVDAHEEPSASWGLPRRKNDLKNNMSLGSNSGTYGNVRGQGFNQNPYNKPPKHVLNKKNDFQNASMLNIDAIFNPVTKVNYIIEVSENQLVQNNMDKSMFIDDITSLLSSNNVIKQNFPFLKTTFDLQNSANPDYGTKAHESLSGTPSERNIQDKPQAEVGLNPLMKGLLDYVDNFSTSELSYLYNSLHPLKRGGNKHNIILEIWTNGSMHPRDALSSAFYNLSFLFLNLQKTKISTPVYQNAFSYSSSKDHPEDLGVDHFYMTEVSKGTLSDFNSKNKQTSETESSNGYLHYDIRVLNLSLRTYTKLKRQKINKINDLLDFSPSTLAQFVDKKSLSEIQRNLLEIGLNLKDME